MNNQKGITLLQTIFFLLLAIFFGAVGLSLAPPFLEHQSVKHSLESLAKTPDIKQLDTPRLRTMLLKRFQVNNIKNAKPKDLELEKRDGNTYLRMGYEVRVHLIGNVDAILKFDESVLVE